MALSLLLPFVTIAVTVMSIWQKAVLISSADWAAQEIDMRGSNVVVKVAALTEQWVQPCRRSDECVSAEVLYAIHCCSSSRML